MAAGAISLAAGGSGPFAHAWSSYNRALKRHPVATQAVTSALLWGLGDGIAQRIESRGHGKLDVRRMAMTAAFGGSVIGPAGHVWYSWLDQLVLKMGLAAGWKAALLKTAADNLLYSPLYVLAFFAYGCLAIDGLPLRDFGDKLRSEFLPTMVTEALVWPPYMALVFSKVPMQHQLLAVNIATVGDVAFLGWVRAGGLLPAIAAGNPAAKAKADAAVAKQRKSAAKRTGRLSAQQQQQQRLQQQAEVPTWAASDYFTPLPGALSMSHQRLMMASATVSSCACCKAIAGTGSTK